MLKQQAVRLGVPEGAFEKIDEQPAGIFQRFRPGSIHQRCFEALAQLTQELAERGGILLVGVATGNLALLLDHHRGFILGSTTDCVSEHGHCTVLIVK